jgi:hypothetical protein
MTENTRPSDEPATGPAARWLAFMLVLVALVQFGGILRVASWPDAPGALSPLLQIGLHGLWALLATWAAFALNRGWANAYRHGLLVLLAFFVYTAVAQIAFTEADYERGRLPFLLGGFGVVIIGILAALVIDWRRATKH